MESAGEITDDLTRFCVSWTTIHAIEPAFIATWNDYCLPGCSGGIPNILARMTNQTTRLNPSIIPTTSDAITLHEELGGQLTRESQFGRDPMASHPQLSCLRQRDFYSRHPTMKDIMESVLHGNVSVFKQATRDFIQLSISYSQLVM